MYPVGWVEYSVSLDLPPWRQRLGGDNAWGQRLPNTETKMAVAVSDFLKPTLDAA